MTTVFSAFLYEGLLSVAALVLYFVLEPRTSWIINVKAINLGSFGNLFYRQRSFLSTKGLLSLCLMLPFMEFLLGFLLQSSDCLSQSSSFCVGVPDILKNNLGYDVFYLRVNDTANGAHWIDYMFLPILFFFTWFLTKDAFFSALNAGFMVFIHESIWFIFYWFVYYSEYQYEGWGNDIAFFILVCTIGFIGIKKYGHYYKNWFFTTGLWIFILFLVAWWSFDDFHVTVINNTVLGNSLKFLVTQWYYEPLANIFEVFSWVLIFSVFLLNLAFVKRTKQV